MKTLVVYSGLLVVGLRAPYGEQAQVTHPQSLPLPSKQIVSVIQTNAQKGDVSGFEAVFTALSQKYQTAFVCESAPYKLTLSLNDAQVLQKRLAPPLSKNDEIVLVAQAYDYDAVFADAHTVLLTKRYSEPEDLPEVTLDEACLYLNNVVKEAAPYADPNPDSSGSYNSLSGTQRLSGVIIDLYNSATLEQKAAYVKGVVWGSMPPDVQARWAYSQASVSLDIPLSIFWRAACRLNAVNKPNATVFKFADFAGIPFPAYEGPFRSPNRPDKKLVYLSGTAVTSVGGATSYSAPYPIVMKEGKITNPFPDPTKPTKEEFAAPPKHRPAYQKTLAQAAVEINARIAKGGKGVDNVVRVTVPAAIDQKTVSLFGANQYLSPLQETKAIAEVYGLRGVLRQNGVADILLPKAIDPVDPTQLWIEALRVLPAPLFRVTCSPKNVPQGMLVPA